MLKAEEADKEAALKTEAKAQPLPEYWLKVFKNCDILGELVEEKDEPVLKHLTKLSRTEEGLNVTYRFYFSANEYFKNDVLTKEIVMESEERPSHSVGTEI